MVCPDSSDATADVPPAESPQPLPRGRVAPEPAQNSPGLDAPGLDVPGLDVEESLAEFRELVVSAGGEVAAELLQRRARPDPATLVGSGKVEEIAGVAASVDADLVLFDHDLSPTQLRNLEAALPCRVLDRTQLILDIFARHARTREGQLQVELAQLEYMLPRLAGRGKSMSQLGGGIGTRGPGETKLETDRRGIQRRIDQLKLDLEAVRRVRKQQRQRREAVPVPTVALVGYTNAGKSTLFNRLTGAHVLQSPRMFATLDPKLRAIELPSRRKVLLSYTGDSPASALPSTSFRARRGGSTGRGAAPHPDAASTYGEEQKSQGAAKSCCGTRDSFSEAAQKAESSSTCSASTSAQGLDQPHAVHRRSRARLGRQRRRHGRATGSGHRRAAPFRPQICSRELRVPAAGKGYRCSRCD